MKITRTVAMIGVVLLVPPALAQQMAVQPQQGQSTQQMNSDISACAASAQQASGYNPAQASAPSQPQVGGRAKGAAAGAAAGAAGGQARSNQYDNLPSGAQEQYRQNQAKSGAAAGAAAGGVKQRQERRETRRETGAQQEAGNAYNQSYRSCLQGRGYAVN
jgi:hypothetical protein